MITVQTESIALVNDWFRAAGVGFMLTDEAVMRPMSAGRFRGGAPAV